MVDLRRRTKPKKLKAILAIPDSSKFLDELTNLAIPPGTNYHPPPEKRHELPQMISTLWGLAVYGWDDIGKWLIEDGQAHWFFKAQVWLKRIGATRARACLDEAAAAFPHGRIPKDDSKRADLILSDEVETRLYEIDRTYKGSFDEMAECLRIHIQQNFELFRKELEDEENSVV